jgi:hypothetical protein
METLKKMEEKLSSISSLFKTLPNFNNKNIIEEIERKKSKVISDTHRLSAYFYEMDVDKYKSTLEEQKTKIRQANRKKTQWLNVEQKKDLTLKINIQSNLIGKMIRYNTADEPTFASINRFKRLEHAKQIKNKKRKQNQNQPPIENFTTIKCSSNKEMFFVTGLNPTSTTSIPYISEEEQHNRIKDTPKSTSNKIKLLFENKLKNRWLMKNHIKPKITDHSKTGENFRSSSQSQSTFHNMDNISTLYDSKIRFKGNFRSQSVLPLSLQPSKLNIHNQINTVDTDQNTTSFENIKTILIPTSEKITEKSEKKETQQSKMNNIFTKGKPKLTSNNKTIPLHKRVMSDSHLLVKKCRNLIDFSDKINFALKNNLSSLNIDVKNSLYNAEKSNCRKNNNLHLTLPAKNDKNLFLKKTGLKSYIPMQLNRILKESKYIKNMQELMAFRSKSIIDERFNLEMQPKHSEYQTHMKNFETKRLKYQEIKHQVEMNDLRKKKMLSRLDTILHYK